MHDKVPQGQHLIPWNLFVLALKVEGHMLHAFAHDFKIANDRVFDKFISIEIIERLKVGSIRANLFHGHEHGIQKEIVSG
jgi:hypothetical protein